ncbi:hypothetical protein BC826DRAFT_705559 [Russula brevipes]|nr:hypothetical protein BC826DRAFT_705559 [Russula brevipes]
MSAKAKTGSRTKRQKIERHETNRKEEQAHQLSRLERVPLEILAEILLYMNSPKDVLSVARCSKNLCATLLNPSNVMIWRRARAHCVVPGLPPPPPGWSESAYAAFIFDRGNCCICLVPTNRMLWSFVARVRLCGTPKCRRRSWITTLWPRFIRIPALGGGITLLSRKAQIFGNFPYFLSRFNFWIL